MASSIWNVSGSISYLLPFIQENSFFGLLCVPGFWWYGLVGKFTVDLSFRLVSNPRPPPFFERHARAMLYQAELRAHFW